MLFLISTFLPNQTTAQLNENQMMTIQYCEVAPSMSDSYRASVKKFVAGLKEADVSSVEWYAHWQDDYTYMYSVPIDNMAEFDGLYWEEAIEKMGAEKFSDLQMAMETNIVKQNLVVYQQIDELSYMHPSLADHPTTFRQWTMVEIDPTKDEELTQLLLGFNS